MSALFNAVANGVSGFMRVGSQSSNPTGTPNVSTSALNGNSRQNSSAKADELTNMVQRTSIESPSAMNVDGVEVNGNDIPEKVQTRKELELLRSTSQTPKAALHLRASSLPLNLEKLPEYRVGYVYDDRMMLHSPATYHPEAPARLIGIHQKLADAGCLTRMKLIPIRLARKYEVLMVHSEDHWEKVQMIASMSLEQISLSESYYEQLSLYVCPKTTLAAHLSCGGVIEATLAVARGELEKAFAIVRPPGHHAEPEEHMGFCFFNNVAVASRVVQQLTPIKKILIFDWDVHHGNGTQRAFLDDPNVLYISIHRFDGGRFYPCGPFGGMDSCGEGLGEGTSVNVPWPEKGMGDAEYLHAFMKIVMPIAMEFAPELVIISAGFDAADGDELGECHVTPAAYAHMTYMLSTLAGGKLVAALEGGYNVDSISRSSLAVTRALLGDAPPELKPLVANEVGTETVWAVARHQSRWWKNVDPKACEPREEYGDQTTSIPELLKQHRQNYLFKTYKMTEVPLLDEEAEDRYQEQILCTPDVMQKDTLVLLVHQFGNLRMEIAGSLTCDVRLEYSYLVDATRNLVDWINKEKFSYVEMNTYPRPIQANHKRPWAEVARDVLAYVWDNYIQLSDAKNVILIGHGPGCPAIMNLIEDRKRSIMSKVKGVILVVGKEDIPGVPRDENELRPWYLKHSFVAVPSSHPFVVDNQVKKRHGKIHTYGESKSLKVLMRALPDIKDFIDRKIPERQIKANDATKTRIEHP